jgi:creatinine amidohydrolase
MGASPAQAELLSPAEIEDRLAVRSIAYLPLGTLEFHGPHLPIGLDALNGHGVCLAAAARSGGIVLPPVYQGFGGSHGPYPWTIMMSGGGGALAANLRDTVVRLQDLGVGTVVIFSGHFAPEQLDAIDEVAATWNRQEGRRTTVVATAVNRCPDAPLAPDHAGAFEATLLSGIAPELVHIDRLPDAEAHPAADPGGDAYGVHRHDPGQPLWGVFGADPRTADLRRGPELLDHLAGWLAASALEAIRP